MKKEEYIKRLEELYKLTIKRKDFYAALDIIERIRKAK
jgi:hypothetical protein